MSVETGMIMIHNNMMTKSLDSFLSTSLFSLQIKGQQFVRNQLYFSDLSSEFQLLPSERAGSESQQAAGFRNGAALYLRPHHRPETGRSVVGIAVKPVTK